jgi:PAP2 superfamily
LRPQLDADRLIGLGTAPTVWLQEHLWHGALDLRWWDFAAWAVYVSYFLATYLLAGWLWFFARDRFRRYVATVSLLALMGFATYALFPAAPPWMASGLGELEPTTRTIGIVSNELPWLDFSTLFERGSEYANPVAAVPSLHAAYTLLVVLVLWPLVPRWARVALALYPPAMAFALVYTAEHYLVDVLLGWAYTLVALWVVDRAAAAWKARGETSPAPSA